MKRVVKVLGIPVWSDEVTYDESDYYAVVSNTGGQFNLAAAPEEEEDEEDYEYSPDDPEGFGFRSLT